MHIINQLQHYRHARHARPHTHSHCAGGRPVSARGAAQRPHRTSQGRQGDPGDAQTSSVCRQQPSGARATSVPPPRLASAKSFSELDSRRPCADPERALCRSRETARINFAEGVDFAEAPVNCAAVAHGSPARIDPSWPDFRRISGRNRPESTHSSRF